MESFIIKSPCKVNLGLKILNQRKDGYHNILSIFIELDLYDCLSFTPSSELSIQFNNAKIPESNSVQDAVNIMSKYYNIDIKYKIDIDKKIPIGGGLGGGSSNAAYTLIALNKLYNLNLSSNILEKLANKIGSDTPFFIRGGIKGISQTGNVIEDINHESIKNKFFLLVIPNFSISTKWAYSKVKKQLYGQKINPKFSPLDDKVDWTLFENDFEHIVCLTYPEILNIKGMLYKSGALYSGLSGSGSTVFGIYNDIMTAKEAAKSLNTYHTHITFPVI